MAVRRDPVIDRKYIFEYDVGQWTFGTMQVLKDRETEVLKMCKVVKKSTLRSTSHVLVRLRGLQELQHPHISSVTDVLEDANNFYIVSDFCQGGDLQDWIERLDQANWLHESTCATYIRQALLALAHSHSAQIFHRDLRPSNMLLTSKLPNAIVKVADFGIAAILDPDNTIAPNYATNYAAPDLHRGGSLWQSGAPPSAADLWSIGAIAHELLVGQPPGGDSAPSWNSPWGFSRRTHSVDDDDIWSERSDYARDFVRRCLQGASLRPTAAKALQHPWMKGLTPLSGDKFLADNAAAKEVRRKTLCYTLGVILLPVVVPYNDFDNLQMTFMQADHDRDGFLPRLVAQKLLLGRCKLSEAVIPALDIVDVGKTDVVDLCSFACADLIVRDFFASGPTHSPLTGPFHAENLAERMLNKFFAVFGDGGKTTAECTVNVATIRGKLRTATARCLEMQARVRYDDLLACLPEGCAVDSSLLPTLVYASAGQGTPLGCDGDLSPIAAEPPPSLPSLLTSGAFSFRDFNPAGLFQSCSSAGKRDRSPCSIRIF